MINKERLYDSFCSLVSIDAPSFKERQMADELKKRLEHIGLVVEEDQAGEILCGNAGNVYARLEATAPGAPMLFCAHMDTVEPSCGKKAIFHEDGRITSDGTTVLGADDVGGLSAILEALQTIVERNIPHPLIEVLFPVAEEPFTRGSHCFDFSKIQSRSAYVLDLDAPIGTAALSAPTILSFTVEVKGKAAHAGFAPNEGINALSIAVEALSKIPTGQVDENSTCNFGLIHGGTQVNIVPECVELQGEIRGFDHEHVLQLYDNIERVFKEECAKANGSVRCEKEVRIHAYCVSEKEDVVQRYLRACEKLGVQGSLTRTLGGSDNNVFLEHDIKGIVVASAMHGCHSTQEYSSSTELAQLAELTVQLMCGECV